MIHRHTDTDTVTVLTSLCDVIVAGRWLVAVGENSSSFSPSQLTAYQHAAKHPLVVWIVRCFIAHTSYESEGMSLQYSANSERGQRYHSHLSRSCHLRTPYMIVWRFARCGSFFQVPFPTLNKIMQHIYQQLLNWLYSLFHNPKRWSMHIRQTVVAPGSPRQGVIVPRQGGWGKCR